MTLDFFKQRYGYEIDGLWMPRVTAVTALVSKANFFASQESADWGTLVHETIAHILKGEQTNVDPVLLPSIEAFQTWSKANSLEIGDVQECIEKKVFDKENMYAGTVDLIAKVRSQLGIIDLKTSSAMRDEYALQTAAYFHAYNQSRSKEKQCKTRWILRIDQYAECRGCFAKQRAKNGKTQASGGNPLCNHVLGPSKGEVEFEELNEHEQDLEAFLSAKELWEWYNRDWLRKITNYPKKFLQKILI